MAWEIAGKVGTRQMREDARRKAESMQKAVAWIRAVVMVILAKTAAALLVKSVCLSNVRGHLKQNGTFIHRFRIVTDRHFALFIHLDNIIKLGQNRKELRSRFHNPNERHFVSAQIRSKFF